MAIHYIDSISKQDATGRIQQVYQELKDEMGEVVEPISLHAILPNLLEYVWGILRETVLVEDQLNRSQKEAIAAAVSVSNNCTYCVDAHTIMLIGLEDKVIANAISRNNPQEIPDEFTRSLVVWSLNTKAFSSREIANPPFEPYVLPFTSPGNHQGKET